MAKISLNSGNSMAIRSFSKQTRIDNNQLVRTATVSFSDATHESELEQLMEGSITSIRLYDDEDTMIYERTGLEGKINSMSTSIYNGQLVSEIHMIF